MRFPFGSAVGPGASSATAICFVCVTAERRLLSPPLCGIATCGEERNGVPVDRSDDVAKKSIARFIAYAALYNFFPSVGALVYV